MGCSWPATDLSPLVLPLPRPFYRGIVVNQADYFFEAVFATEMLLKMLSLGVFAAPGTYFRDSFNYLDFIVVILGFVNYLPGVGNYTAIRVCAAAPTMILIRGVRP